MNINAMNSQKVYVICKRSDHLCVYHKRQNYLIAFQNITHARKVQYTINIEPQIMLLRDTNIDLHQDMLKRGYDVRLNLDVNSTLFIPKNKEASVDCIDDGLFTMHPMTENDFYGFPMQYPKARGIVVPYFLIDETDDEFMFRCHVVDPIDTI